MPTSKPAPYQPPEVWALDSVGTSLIGLLRTSLIAAKGNHETAAEMLNDPEWSAQFLADQELLILKSLIRLIARDAAPVNPSPPTERRRTLPWSQTK